MVTNGCRIQRAVDSSLDVIAEEMADLYKAVEAYDNPDFRPKDASFFQEMYKSLNLEKDLFLAWNTEGHLDGMARVYEMSSSTIGVSVNIRPECIGEGLGSKLFNEVIEEAESRECATIRTIVPSYRPHMVNLAKKQGFEIADTRIRMSTEITQDILAYRNKRKEQLSEMQSEDELEIWKDLQDTIFEDAPLYEPFSLGMLSTFKNKPHFIGYIAYRDAEPIGYCVGWEENPEDFFVFGIGIIEEYQHEGYGTVLLAHTLYEAKNQGMSKSSLSVEADNEQAIEFYKTRFNYQEKFRRIHLEKPK